MTDRDLSPGVAHAVGHQTDGMVGVSQTPSVSVVLVNFRGVADTLEAIGALRGLDWPQEKLEIVVVDNASGDDSVATLKARAPEVTLVESASNLGFAGGCNLGVRHSSGEVVAFLNNDAKPDPGWLRFGVEALLSSPKIRAVASRVLDWEGKTIDFAGAGMTWYGMGYRPLSGHKASPKKEAPAGDVLFGTGSAMIVDRAVFESLGGFDEDYFMFFEDVDFGWRLNLLGYRYYYEPRSLVFHKHHQSMTGIGNHKEEYLLERNALMTLYKNLGEEKLQSILPAAMLMSTRRAISRTGIDTAQFDIRRSDPVPEAVDPIALVPLMAMDQFIEALPRLKEKRRQIQATRQVSDWQMWKLFGEPEAPMSTEPNYLRGYDMLQAAFDVVSDPVATSVLIVTGDPLGPKLSGPGIRAWQMAKALSASHEVTLITLTELGDVDHTGFDVAKVTPGDDKAFSAWEAWADVIIFQGHALDLFESLRRSSKRLVVDVYDPMHIEQLEQARHLPTAQWESQVADATESITGQLLRGDFFLCASERQRHFYLGQLTTLGRVTPASYRDDPHLERLIGVVPFGIPDWDPTHDTDVLKGVHPGIGKKDLVLLWSGGLYNWFDPLTLIRAVALLAPRQPSVRLFFQGTKHPHPGVPEMPIVEQSRALAAELGVLDQNVFFNDSWVDYSTRHNYLLEADLGVSTHRSHLETEFAFRTRVLDYLWAGLPMVLTEGDHFADLVSAHGLGLVVPAGDAEALADALEKALTDKAFRDSAKKAISEVRELYRWAVTLRPLLNYVAKIGAPDEPPVAPREGRVRFSPLRPRRARFRAGDIGRGIQRLFRGEFILILRAIKRRLLPRSR
jgi:GT2 family glycosyltransferase/glycosyltransferase involved in cell wall biosynthesis